MDIFEAIARGITDELKQNGLSVSVYESYIGLRCWEIEQNTPPWIVITLQNEEMLVYRTEGTRHIRPPFISLNYSDPNLIDTLIILLRDRR